MILADTVPNEVWAGLAALCGAAALWFRKQVAKVPTPKEQSMAACLQLLSDNERRLSRIEEVLGKPICPWAEGQIPQHYRDFIRAKFLELKFKSENGD